MDPWTLILVTWTILKLHKNGSEILDGFTKVRGTSANTDPCLTMTCILDLQDNFFKSGDVKDLKPMKLLDVAQKVKLDISLADLHQKL